MNLFIKKVEFVDETDKCINCNELYFNYTCDKFECVGDYANGSHDDGVLDQLL